MKKALLMLVVGLAACTLMGKDQIVKRDRTYLRKGAGSYFEVLKQVPTKSKVDVQKQDNQWLEVLYLAQKGFIPVSALEEPVKRNDMFANMPAPKAAVTSHGVSAGVKGFSDKFSGDFKGNPAFADYALAYQLNLNAYDAFVKETYKKNKLSSFHKAYPLPKRVIQDYYTEAAEGFGLALAGIIANQGLYENKKLTEYVNYVGTLVAANSDVPDIQFRFFILDISQPNGYACPGGYIFITKGMLQLIENEAELAFVLAHEIAHISRFHGIIETKRMEHHIGAEDMFAELDAEVSFSAKNKAVEAELEADIREILDILIQGRLDEYEEEADILGMLFTARSGYDPTVAPKLITRLLNTRYESNNQHYRKDSIRLRSGWIGKESGKYQKTKQGFFQNESRYLQHKSLLDRP